MSASKVEEFFSFQLEEIEIRYYSIVNELEAFEELLFAEVNVMKKKLKKINRRYRKVKDYLNSSSAYYDDDYKNCEKLYRYSIKMLKSKHLFDQMLVGKLFETCENKEKPITSTNLGNIKVSINLNVKRFKSSNNKVYEFSSQLGSIGGICKLDNENFVATNPSINSLVVFDHKFNIVKTVTTIMQTRLNYPMAICTNNVDSIYVCDCHNLRVLILNKDLNTIKTTLSTSYNPSDICFDSSFLYILYSERKSIHKFNSEGILLTRLELKPTKLALHSEIDPMRIVVQNTKIVALYSNKQVYVHDINENLKLIDNPRQIRNNSSINAICFSSPSLLTIHNDGTCYFHDLINQFSDTKEYEIIHDDKIDILGRAIPCFITYVDECLFITFQHPKSHWLMKIDIR